MAEPAARPIRGATLVLMTLGLSLGTFMQVLDSSIANVSLPAIAGDLAASPSQGAWVITSFAVANAITLPLTGWLARRFGDVRLFVASLALFTAASWLCGLATSLPMLIAARILQGAVAGPMIPLSQSLLLNHYPPEKKGLALALWSTTVVVAPALGPILGGWITDNISWPWIFYINLPVGLLSAVLTWMILGRRASPRESVPVDRVGLVLLVIGVGALQVMFDKGNELDWFASRTIILLAVTAVTCLALLVIWELTERHPVIDLSLFRERNFLVGSLLLSIGYMVFFGNVVILPLWVQTNLGYTATWAGLVAAPMSLLPIVVTPLVGRYMHRVDLRWWAAFSFAVFAAASFWNAHFNTGVTFEQIVVPRLLMGFAVATFFVPLTALTLSNVPPAQMPSAAGLSNFLRILAGGFGTSLSITLWERREIVHRSDLVAHVSAFDPYAAEALGGLPAEAPGAAVLEQLVGEQALMLATNDVLWVSAWIFVGLMVLVWFARPTRYGDASSARAPG